LNKVLILGGYGNFGKRIATALTKSGIAVIIAGRDEKKVQDLAAILPKGLSEIAVFDVNKNLSSELEKLKPAVVINTCGPFQESGYEVAETCINHKVHYIDISDGRKFVTGITAFNEKAREAGITVISGSSTVPGLSSAVLEHYRQEFSEMDSLKYGISPGQKAERGLATTKAIMSYVGKPLSPFSGKKKIAYGWQDIYCQEYPGLGKRWMANCDIPDLDLFPAHYGIKSIQFSAGLELGFMHLGLWLVSWLVRAGPPIHLPNYSAPLLRISNWFNIFGSSDGGMHIIIKGKDKETNHVQL